MNPTLAYMMMTALLALFPHSPREADILRNQWRIAKIAAEAAEQNSVPLPVLLAVGFQESHWGTDPTSGGGWGAPIDRLHRHIPGTALIAAHILSVGMQSCGSWEGSMARFRSGHCRGNRVGDVYASHRARHAFLINQRVMLDPIQHLYR